jgi:hypothetical protein
MGLLATGIFKLLTYKAELTYGTAPAAASAQSLRRVTSTLDLAKDTYESNEIRDDQQMADFRHGVRRVSGSISGELSPKTYADFFANALRRDFTAGVSVTGASITVAASSGNYTLTRAAGSWLTDGVKKGDVVRLTAGTFNALNLNKNLLVLNVTALVLTVRVVNRTLMQAEGPIASATCAVVGKKTFAPVSGHTDKSFSIEHVFNDLTPVLSELYTGCKVNQIALKLPPTGLATIDVGITGQDCTDGTAQYFTSPTAATTTGLTAAVNGIAVVNGNVIVDLTGLDVTLSSALTGDPVVGSNVVPAQFPGRIKASGQFTAYLRDNSQRQAFVNESEVDLYLVLTTDNTANASFIALSLPRIKVNGTGKNDGEGAIIQTIPFQALLAVAGGAGTAMEKTTFVVQDSDA